MARLYPSLMAADMLNLKSEIMRVESFCDGFHLDIMDNHFVQNLTFGPDIINAIAKATNKQLWLHLMVNDPQLIIRQCTIPTGSIISIHFEITKSVPDILKSIKENNCLPSIAINPKTNVEDIFPLLDIVDQVLIMSVDPGYYGQRFLESVIDKLGPLKGYRQTRKLSFRIGIDGGVNEENIIMLAQKGIDDFAIGSAIFKSPDPQCILEAFKKLTQ